MGFTLIEKGLGQYHASYPVGHVDQGPGSHQPVEDQHHGHHAVANLRFTQAMPVDTCSQRDFVVEYIRSAPDRV